MVWEFRRFYSASLKSEIFFIYFLFTLKCLYVRSYQQQVLREKDVLDQQRKYVLESTSKDEQLKRAFEEISTLNKKLAEEKAESEEKVGG